MFAKIALREVEVGEGGVGFLQLVMGPVDAAISIFYSSASLWVILHDLTGPDFPFDINLPEYYFLLCRGTQQVVVGCLSNLQIREIFA